MISNIINFKNKNKIFYLFYFLGLLFLFFGKCIGEYNQENDASEYEDYDRIDGMEDGIYEYYDNEEEEIEQKYRETTRMTVVATRDKRGDDYRQNTLKRLRKLGITLDKETTTTPAIPKTIESFPSIPPPFQPSKTILEQQKLIEKQIIEITTQKTQNPTTKTKINECKDKNKSFHKMLIIGSIILLIFILLAISIYYCVMKY
ncbi:unnamed protein product [Meloidogyne enterolobii]|uniref:Uncharacterized protein n=1 Tax=Meloidogyne enterolobii TaxID=390850 RepID=A0ACB1AHZ0_MELEN